VIIKDIRWQDGHLKADQKSLFLSCTEGGFNGKFATQAIYANYLLMVEAIISILMTQLMVGIVRCR
jgi:hypothetical protein